MTRLIKAIRRLLLLGIAQRPDLAACHVAITLFFDRYEIGTFRRGTLAQFFRAVGVAVADDEFGLEEPCDGGLGGDEGVVCLGLPLAWGLGLITTNHHHLEWIDVDGRFLDVGPFFGERPTALVQHGRGILIRQTLGDVLERRREEGDEVLIVHLLVHPKSWSGITHAVAMLVVVRRAFFSRCKIGDVQPESLEAKVVGTVLVDPDACRLVVVIAGLQHRVVPICAAGLADVAVPCFFGSVGLCQGEVCNAESVVTALVHGYIFCWFLADVFVKGDADVDEIAVTDVLLRRMYMADRSTHDVV